MLPEVVGTGLEGEWETSYLFGVTQGFPLALPLLQASGVW